MTGITNVLIAGLGGQSVLTASDLLAFSAFEFGFDVKKSEIKGMSQRGGSVSSDVRFGKKVWSPMIPPCEADYLVVLEPTQIEPNLFMLKEGGLLITPKEIDLNKLPGKQTINSALLGALSLFLPIPVEIWFKVMSKIFLNEKFEKNKVAFLLGCDSFVKKPVNVSIQNNQL